MAVGTGLCAGIAAGFLVTDGDVVGLAVATIALAAAVAVSYLVVPASTRPVVIPIVVLAVLLRVAAAVVLYDAFLAAGRGGFVTGDDAGYANLSARLARILHGENAPFNSASEGYLLGTYVYLETAVFYLAGPNAVYVEFLNAAMGGLLVMFAFDIARRLAADVRTGVIAGCLVALYPSLVLWSALNLKDSLALLLVAMVLWLLLIFQTTPGRWWVIPVAYLVLLPMDGLRNYIFLGLSLVIPASVALTPRLRARKTALMTALAVSLSILFLATQSNSTGFRSISDFDAERNAMGVGANTNFGDLSVPVRVIYVLFSPFPWSLRRALDLLPVPEMLLWYAALVGAFVVVVRRSPPWPLLVPIVFFIGGTMTVFVLAEANVGTLFRHRAMVVPFVLILAAPAFASAVTALQGRVRLLSQARRPQLAQ
jgi:hypothetical protein